MLVNTNRHTCSWYVVNRLQNYDFFMKRANVLMTFITQEDNYLCTNKI